MCTKGCGDDYLATNILEYEGNKPVKSCRQLVAEHPTWCAAGPGTKLCGKVYAFNFTFKEKITYHGDYHVKTTDTRTYGSCGWGEGGWQTDASCIGRWAQSGFMEDPCWTCKLDRITENLPFHFSVPMGVSFVYDSASGAECGIPGTVYLGPNYDSYSGSLYFSENYANANCKGSGWMGSLHNCTFNQDDTFWVWTAENSQSFTSIEFDAWIFGHVKSYVACAGLGLCNCPKLAICENPPPP
jgi:hypothetical protein